MSTMLEKAIVDAAALKEAALKNAEAAIIEKYAPQIKDAVAALLEQEEEDLGMEEDPMDLGAELGGDLGAEEEGAEAAVPDLARADVGGEKLCPCPDDEDVIEVDFNALVSDMEDTEEVGAPESQEAMAAGMPAMAGLEEEIDLSEESLKDLVEEVDISDDLLESIVEKLTVDMAVVPDAQQAAAQYTPEAHVNHAEEIDAAVEQDDTEEEHVPGAGAMEPAREEHHLHEVNKLKESNKRLKSTIMQMKDLLEEANLSNAKLIYTNRVLTSTSLNERQKTKFVEAIDNAVSVKEAKVIYETLQSTVGKSRASASPQSLSEVVKRGSSTVLPRRNSKANNSTDNFTTNRWKRLAGIKK